MNVPHIEIGKRPHEPLHISQMWLLPAKTPFGNMALKHTKVVQTLDHVNRKLQCIYADWQSLRIGQPPTIDDLLANRSPTAHLLLIEEAIYFLRKVADDLIATAFLLYRFHDSNQYPTTLEIDSIGSLLHTKAHLEFKERLSDAVGFLELLNDISNAYKHSFVNSDISLIGQLEPCAPALALKQNNLERHEEKLYVVAVSHIVHDFNKFYELMREVIMNYNPGHLPQNVETDTQNLA